MRHEVLMPRLSDAVEEGVLVVWFVEAGAPVKPGDLLAEVQVEKTSAEVHAPTAGRLTELRVGPGGVIAQGAVLAVIEEGSGATEAAAANVAGARPRDRSATAAGQLVSPAAKRLARELGVDLLRVVGSGPAGRIVETDIRAAAANQQSTAGSEPITTMRRTIANRLRSWQTESAQVTITTSADVTELSAALAQLANGAERSPSLVTAAVRACALALRKHPRLAARWTDQALLLPQSIDIGVAVALEEGLIVPVVRGADAKDLCTLDREIGSLAARARASKLAPDEVEGGVFSISNLGGFGIDAFTPLLNPPQTAILGMGRAQATPAVVNGGVGVRTKMTLSLTFDHRVVDGAPAAAFLRDLVSLLQEPTVILGSR